MKRNKTNEIARQRNQSVKSSLRTAIRNFRAAVTAGEKRPVPNAEQSTSSHTKRAVGFQRPSTC